MLCTCRLSGTAAARGIVSSATGGVRRGWSGGGGLADEQSAAMASSSHTPPRSSHRSRSQSTTSSSPFYGTPRPPSSRYVAPPDDAGGSSSTDLEQGDRHLPPLSPLQRLATLVHSSLTALNDPTRADAVAAVGEVTGSYALSRMRAGMEANEVGRRILTERPLVDEKVAERAFELLQLHTDETSPSNVNFHNPINGGRERGMTFGAAYATFLQTHEFDPNERSAVRFISDPDLSYVMTRYRQCHDYWHVLTGLPPTVLGELALKWLELMQTGLPLAALSATGGALAATGLGAREREVLWEVYLPWAVRVGGTMREHSLMCTYYEEELETELGALRERMGVEAAPIVEL